MKSKMAVASSSRIESEDVEMLDAEYASPNHGSSDLQETLNEKVSPEGKEGNPIVDLQSDSPLSLPGTPSRSTFLGDPNCHG